MSYLNMPHRKRKGTGEREWLMKSHGYQSLALRAGIYPTKDAIGVWFSDGERVTLARMQATFRAGGRNPKNIAASHSSERSRLEKRLKLLTAAEEAQARVQAAEEALVLAQAHLAKCDDALNTAPRQ